MTARFIVFLVFLVGCVTILEVGGLEVGGLEVAGVQADDKKIGYDDTPLQPNGKWHIHDGRRPAPRIITPGAHPGEAPSDAIVLLGAGRDVSAWRMVQDGQPMTWTVKDGVLESGKGMVRTKDEFGDIQLHVEWASPAQVKGDGQGRGNSGVFLQGLYEVQVLDSYQSATYPDGQAAAMYGQYPPLVNASLKPGQWQVYDILFTAPRFKDGKLEKAATITVLHNGVVVHNATAYLGPTQHKAIAPYKPAVTRGPLVLQDHGNPVHFRNIWLRPLGAYDDAQ